MSCYDVHDPAFAKNRGRSGVVLRDASIHDESCLACHELKAHYVRRDGLGVAVFGFDEMFRFMFGHDYRGDGPKEAYGPTLAEQIYEGRERSTHHER